jgi:hypothetical protein
MKLRIGAPQRVTIFIAIGSPNQYGGDMSKLHQIQETAIETALRDLLVIRPDLDNEQTRALARLVARSAVDEVITGLRTEGMIAEPAETTADGRGSKVDVLTPLIETGLAMIFQNIKAHDRDQWDRKRKA